jgi:RHS repeat-associated protein
VAQAEGSVGRTMPRDLTSVTAQQYSAAPTTNRHQLEMTISSDQITAALATPAALVWGDGSKAEFVKVSGVTRQVVTDDCITDVRMSDDNSHMVMKIWTITGALGSKVSGLYTRPSHTPLSEIRFQYSTPASGTARLDITTIENTGLAGTRTIVERFTQTTSPDQMVVQTWENAAGTGTLLKEETLTYSARGAKTWDYTLVREVKEASVSAAGVLGSLETVSRTREVYRDFSTSGEMSGRRLMLYEVGNGSDSPRATTYTYYEDEGNFYLHGRIKSVEEPDGTWQYHDFSDSASTPVPTETVYRSWNDVAIANRTSALMEVREIEANKVTITRSVGTTQIAKEEWLTSVETDGTVIRTVRKWDGTAWHEEVSGYHPESAVALLAGRIMWRELADGTAETWSYTGTVSAPVITHRRGAGSRSGVTKGTQTQEAYNRTGHEVTHMESEFDGATQVSLGYWIGTVPDNSGRPTHFEYDGNSSDYMDVQYACCGLASKRQRDGSTTAYSRDGLKRVYKVIAKSHSGDTTPITTTTVVTGLVTESQRNGLLTSKIERHLNGDILSTWSPDADGDTAPEETTYSYAAAGNGTRVETITAPDGGTTVTSTYRDGRTQSITGTATAPQYFEYGTHTEQGGGLLTQAFRGTANTATEWVKSYNDQLGRSFKTEFPGSAIQTSTYHAPTASAGSRGKLAATKDADENATPGSGSYSQYSYNSEGEQSTTVTHLPADPMMAPQTMVSATTRDAVSSITLQGVTFGPALKSTSTVNSITVSESWQSVDGRTSGSRSFGNESLTQSTLPSGGAWTVTSTAPDGTKAIQSYSDGVLSEAKQFTNAGTAPGNLVASMSYTYDSHGRLATTTDSRTGTTTMGSYTDSGNLLSITDPGSRTTSFTFDVMSRRLTVDAPDTLDADANTLTNVTHSSYYPTGQIKAQWGDQTNATFNVYDAQNRQVELRTYQALTHGTEPTAATGGADTTTWTYSPTRGFLTRKEYADTKGTDYTYTASGRLTTRTWERGVVTTYTYAAGNLVHTNYSDTTPDVTVAYDSFGRQTSVTNGVATSTYSFDPATLALDTETISYDLNADSTPDFTRVIDRSQDALERDSGWQLKDGATVENEVAYAFDISGRLGSATSPAGTFTYGYQTNSMRLLHTVTGPAHTVTNTWEATRDVLTQKGNKVGTTVISAYDYSVNPLGQRTEVAKTGSAFASNRSIAWGYDALGQVTKADSSITGFDRAYEFDGIGNRKKAADSLTLPGSNNYTANALNQYTVVDTINPAYDDDGNATAYPVLAYLSANSTLAWDAENRLKSATVNGTTTTYLYDSGSRRIAQTTGSATTVYVYDAWNPIAEFSTLDFETFDLQRSYTWGLDLSGSLQGAGGVGGLSAVTDEAASGTPSYFPTFDGNGNVSEYLDGIGAVVAHYEYDPFGRTTVASGTKAGDFSHRFSTKPVDSATGLLYYGYRFYDPVTGRWPSRDPIEEAGGVNLYGFIGNRTTYLYDLLGMCEQGDPPANIKIESVSYGYNPLSEADLEKRKELALKLLATADLPIGVTSPAEALQWIAMVYINQSGTAGIPITAKVADLIKEYGGLINDTATKAWGGFIYVDVSFDCCDCGFFYNSLESQKYTHKHAPGKNPLVPFKERNPTKADFEAAKKAAIASVKCL